MLFQKVLVPLDGSDLAQQALPYAETIALRKKSEVALLSVINTDFEHREERLHKSHLDLTAKRLQAQGIHVSTEIVHGHVAEEIIEYAANHNINIIIISTHGYSGVKRWMLGSVAQKVLYSSRTPVLLIKSQAPSQQKAYLNKILVPLDGSPFSEAIFPYLERLTIGTDTVVTLLEVVESPIVPSYGTRPINPTWEKYRDSTWAELQQQAEQNLQNVQNKLKDKGISANIKVVKAEIGEVATTIMQIAQNEKMDMIAIATHGRTGVSRWMYGNIANKLVDESIQPLLLVRPEIPGSP